MAKTTIYLLTPVCRALDHGPVGVVRPLTGGDSFTLLPGDGDWKGGNRPVGS